MRLECILLLTTLTLLCNGKKDTSCNFNYYSGWCQWYTDSDWFSNCRWELHRSIYRRNEGYLYLNGAHQCTATFSWKFSFMDSAATNYLTIEYYVVGHGRFDLYVFNDVYNQPDWSCSIEPGIEKRKAYVSVTGNAGYIHIRGKASRGSRIVITQIWNSLHGHKVERKCPPLPTTPRPTTKPTTTPTTPTTTPTTRPTTTPTTRPTTTTKAPTTTRLTTRSTTMTTTIYKTTRPTTMSTTIRQITDKSTAKSSQTITRFKTPKWNPTMNISKSTVQESIMTTPTKKSDVSPSSHRNERTSPTSNVATLQSTFNKGLTSTTASISRNNASSGFIHSVSTHSSTWTTNPLTNRATNPRNGGATSTPEVNPALSTVDKQVKSSTGGVNSKKIPNTQPTLPTVMKMTTGSETIPESTSHNVQMGKSSAETGIGKKKKIIIGCIVGVSTLMILIVFVINFIVKRYIRSSGVGYTVTYTNKAFQ